MSILDATVGNFGKLEKLVIKYEEKARGAFTGALTALFNPTQLRYDNRAEWRATGTIGQSIAAGYQRMEFQATPPATLALDLFFDTYEGAPLAGASSLLGSLAKAVTPDNPFSAGTTSATPVTDYIVKVAALAHVAQELHRPPVCKLQWGSHLLFVGVLTQLHQDLTFFMPDGTPVRATLGCTFMAYRTFQDAAADVELHSADVAKRHVVMRGETVSSIAAAEYGDPARWRDIAIENDIDNPREVTPGTVLVIPKLVS